MGNRREIETAVEPTGHLQVKKARHGRAYWAFWNDADGKHGRRLGPAHVKDSGRKTARGAVIWRAGDGPKPTPEHLTPKDAQASLARILQAAPRVRATIRPINDLQEACEAWLASQVRDDLIKRSTAEDYEWMFERLYREIGAETPLDELDASELTATFEDFVAERQIGAVRAEALMREGKIVREVVKVARYGWPPGQRPIEVPTKQEAVEIAERLGWRWKHRRPGAYRVTPVRARRAERLGRAAAARLEEQGWEIEIRELRHWVVVESASVQTRNKYRDMLGAVLDRAKSKGWLETNPVDDVPRAVRSRRERDRILRREDFFDVDEIEVCLSHAPGLFEETFWRCGFDAGLRLPGEALGLKWGAVDFEAEVIRPYGNWVRNRDDDTKTGIVEPIPMTPLLKAGLLKLRQRSYSTGDGDYVFTRDPLSGAPADPVDLRTAFAATIAAAGLKSIPMYSTRHSFGTALARERVDVRTISGLMRHRRLNTTAIYMAYSPRPDLQAVVTRALDPAARRAATTATVTAPTDKFWQRLDEEVPAKWAAIVRELWRETG